MHCHGLGLSTHVRPPSSSLSGPRGIFMSVVVSSALSFHPSSVMRPRLSSLPHRIYSHRVCHPFPLLYCSIYLSVAYLLCLPIMSLIDQKRKESVVFSLNEKPIVGPTLCTHDHRTSLSLLILSFSLESQQLIESRETSCDGGGLSL